MQSLSLAEQAIFWALALLAAIWGLLILRRFLELEDHRKNLNLSLAQAERLLESADRRLEALIRIGHETLQAADENDVILPVLRLLVDLTAARGASFVPLDDHGQPQTALSHGELPFPVMEAWVEYLATPGVRDRCRNCEFQDGLPTPSNCPLLQGPFADSVSLLCLPVSRGDREYGVTTLFLDDMAPIDPRTHAYLRALMDEIALGLEGIRLRRREQDALRQMQTLRQRTDLAALLKGLLENVQDTLEADFSMLVVPSTSRQSSTIELMHGQIPKPALPVLEGILQGIVASGESVALGDAVKGRASPSGINSLIAAPLISPERTIFGAVLVGNRSGGGFLPRQSDLLQTVAGQVALVVQNASLMDELEYKTMMRERSRLAREIHDGLAQTIGLLKLQAAQLRSYLARGEVQRASQSAEFFYSTLSETYLDARQAIDDLRISSSGCDLPEWVGQAVDEFQELSGLPVELQDIQVQSNLPPEVLAQLIRILQEALSNVRKHARASQIWVVCQEIKGDLILEVRDDGDGFSPEDVSSASRYGLRGMRERADLIGADFQVISRPQEGTTVRLRLPLKGLGEMVT